jgi:SAM-dependent methyltransferase
VNTQSRRDHWEKVYATKAETDVSWFEETPALSLDMILATGFAREATVIDVGAGASRLIDALLQRGFTHFAALDVCETALAISRARLGAVGLAVEWIVADITQWRAPEAAYDLWHDRAVFHFLVEESDRRAYVEALARALKPGGYAVVASFALDGPERCSGLPVARYDGETLAITLGPRFERLETRLHAHKTPAGAEQRFQFSLFRRGAP